jgi:hypothetical protein
MATSGQKRRRPQTEIRFPIERRTDQHKRQYWIGWTDAPADLDLRECTFFIFVGDNPEVCIRRRQDVRETRGGESREDRQDGCDDEGLPEYDEDDGYDDYQEDDEDER